MATVKVLVEFSVTYSKIVSMEINDDISHDLGGATIMKDDEYFDLFSETDELGDIVVPSGEDCSYVSNSMEFESFRILPTDSISFDADDVLTIRYANYGNEDRNYDALFDYLGDFDIITASEIGEDIIISNEEVYKFTKKNELALSINGFVKLDRISCLEEYLDMENESHKSFSEWFYNK